MENEEFAERREERRTKQNSKPVGLLFVLFVSEARVD